jgi:polysaccharide deacetylase 2 family uncharacterized protein YibQ
MAADELSAPLGQETKRGRGFSTAIMASLPQAIAIALATFLGAFVLWAIIADNPFGGEPMAVVQIGPPAPAAPRVISGPAAREAPAVLGANASAPADSGPTRYDGPPEGPVTTPVPPGLPAPLAPGVAEAPPNAGNSRTVTIIDGKTGARQEVVIPGSSEPQSVPSAPSTSDASPSDPAAEAQPNDQKLVETTPQGHIPKIAANGMRPAEAYAQPVKPVPGKPDAPRVALIVGGLGVSASISNDAISKLPGAVTLAFMPYSYDVDHLAGRARRAGHEILLQAPMEPFNYPDNDSGPQTLLTTLSPEQNLERLYWLMSRFQGYVGITGAMGARFTASEQAFTPILRETAKRGLIFVDDGANPRSVAARVAGGNSLPFAKADMVLDSVPTPAEIDHALGRLEMTARERGVAVGMASALPVSIERIVKWAKAAESRGLQLVPITAVATKAKQS